MSLKLEIYLPKETVYEMDSVEQLVLDVGDLLAKEYGNPAPNGQKFDLEDLKSFIVIRDDELPDPEKFQEEDLFLVIPLEGEKDE